MHVVRNRDYMFAGCVYCGCDYCFNAIGVRGGGVSVLECGECNESFIVLADGRTQSTMGFGVKEGHVTTRFNFIEEGIPELVKQTCYDDDGYWYPTVGEHPRRDIAKHEYVKPDIRPDDGIGEFWTPRGVGHDGHSPNISGFVKSKQAGERILEMFQNARNKNNQFKDESTELTENTWLDYRKREPDWIQFKVSSDDADVNRLYELTKDTSIITQDIIDEVCK